MAKPRIEGVRVGRRIGRGEHSRVYLGHRGAALGQPVAVKVQRIQGRAHFLREAGRAMLPTHANLVQAFDAGISDGRGYVVMQWVDGVDLELAHGLLQLHNRRIAQATAVFIVAQVLRGLDYLHRLDGAGQAHGDVDATHVLLSVCGEVKLASFGRARVAAPADDIAAVGALLQRITDPAQPVLAALGERLRSASPAGRATAREALQALQSWSGYREETTAVAALVQSIIGVEHPRTDPPEPLPPPARWSRVVAAAATAAGVAGAWLWP